MNAHDLPEPVLGHAEAEQALLQAWRSGRMHHAWLLTGPPGIGKAALAHQFARLVLAGPGNTNAARRAVAGTHADLLVIARAMDEKRQRVRHEIVLDDVRPVGAFLHRTAAEGGWRVVIVDGADHLNRNAANALLKLLEEPPSRALILLVCSAPGRLLATLRSRCRILRLAPLDDSAMDALVGRMLPELDSDRRRKLVEISDGSPGRAVSLAADDGIALSGLVSDILARHDRGPGLWSYETADAVLQREGNFSSFFALLSASISSTIKLAAIKDGVRPETAAGDSALAEKLLTSRPAEAWAEICAQLARLCGETENLNLDKRQAVLTGLSLLSG